MPAKPKSKPSAKPTPIPNKYDIHTVETKINELFTTTTTDLFKTQKSTFAENAKMLFGIVLSAVILLSYFHKTPFPEDKPLIAVCLVAYFFMTNGLELYNKYIQKNIFASFSIEENNVGKDFQNLKKLAEKGKVGLGLRSTVADYSNRYVLEVLVGDKIGMKTIEYNDYVTEDGFLLEEELIKILKETLKSCK